MLLYSVIAPIIQKKLQSNEKNNKELKNNKTIISQY